MNSNRLSQKSSEFFECLEIESAYTPTIFESKPQTKAFQHARPRRDLKSIISIISKILNSIVQR